MNLEELLRPSVQNLQPYKSARSQFLGDGYTLLDANENPFGDGVLNRYPDPMQTNLRGKIATREGLATGQVLLSNGSDELIDLLTRTLCEPKADAITVCPPTFGMYSVAAHANETTVNTAPLLAQNWQLDVPAILANQSKILWIANPNNPTGNCFAPEDIQTLLDEWGGVVVLDEAYIEFCPEQSSVSLLAKNPRLVILRTFSKYWAMAGARCGYALASAEIIEALCRLKPPYNVNNLTAKAVLRQLENEPIVVKNASLLVKQRDVLAAALSTFSWVETVFPSHANFLWIETEAAQKVAHFLREQGILIRAYGAMPNYMRISVGTAAENKKLIDLLLTFPR